MKARFREITEKYKSFRHTPDANYLSRALRTLFSKFTKKGKKAIAQKHIGRALQRFRFTFRKPGVYYVLIRLLRDLRTQFTLAPKRKGKQILDVPVPVRRNKQDTLNLQIIAKAIFRRRERAIHERWEQELVALTAQRKHSSTFRQQSLFLARLYEERIHLFERWK